MYGIRILLAFPNSYHLTEPRVLGWFTTRSSNTEVT